MWQERKKYKKSDARPKWPNSPQVFFFLSPSHSVIRLCVCAVNKFFFLFKRSPNISQVSLSSEVGAHSAQTKKYLLDSADAHARFVIKINCHHAFTTGYKTLYTTIVKIFLLDCECWLYLSKELCAGCTALGGHEWGEHQRGYFCMTSRMTN